MTYSKSSVQRDQCNRQRLRLMNAGAARALVIEQIEGRHQPTRRRRGGISTDDEERTGIVVAQYPRAEFLERQIRGEQGGWERQERSADVTDGRGRQGFCEGLTLQ